MLTELLKLERFAYLPDGTFGRLTMPDGTVFQTAEKPWEYNKQFVSCIPEGTYPLLFRKSDTIFKTSNGAYLEGWELQNVEGREHILLHPGNWPSSVQGCIAVGKSFSPLRDPKSSSLYGVTSSQLSFKSMMGLLDPKKQYSIRVTGLIASSK